MSADLEQHPTLSEIRIERRSANGATMRCTDVTRDEGGRTGIRVVTFDEDGAPLPGVNVEWFWPQYPGPYDEVVQAKTELRDAGGGNLQAFVDFVFDPATAELDGFGRGPHNVRVTEGDAVLGMGTRGHRHQFYVCAFQRRLAAVPEPPPVTPTPLSSEDVVKIKTLIGKLVALANAASELIMSLQAILDKLEGKT